MKIDGDVVDIDSATTAAMNYVYENLAEGLISGDEDERLSYLLTIIEFLIVEDTSFKDTLNELLMSDDLEADLYNSLDDLYSRIEEYGEGNVDQIMYLACLHNIKYEFEPKEEVVYFILNSLGRTKIGYTSDIDKRFKALKYASGDDLKVIAVYAPKLLKAPQLESLLHNEYGGSRIFGEWFELTTPIGQILNKCSELDAQ